MEQLKEKLGWLALPYLFIVSAVYHVSFWNKFNVDILNYLGLQDAINGILFPLFDNFSQILPALLISGVFSIIYYFISLKIKHYSNTFNNLILITYMCLVVAISSIIIIYMGTNLLRFPLFVLIILFCLKEFESRKEGFNDYYFTAIVLILIPFNFGYIGFANALDIIQGKKFQYIETNLLNNKINFEEYDHLIFLGKGGEFFIFTTPDLKKNLIASQSDFKNLVINSYPRTEGSKKQYLIKKLPAGIKNLRRVRCFHHSRQAKDLNDS